ncbi:MAG: hypothetical protein IKD03_06390, partial [Clostridia bacterium]|nr:hypothetical protein [Clostridia bacterium]
MILRLNRYAMQRFVVRSPCGLSHSASLPFTTEGGFVGTEYVLQLYDRINRFEHAVWSYLKPPSEREG